MPQPASAHWAVTETVGSAQEFHNRPFPRTQGSVADSTPTSPSDCDANSSHLHTAPLRPTPTPTHQQPAFEPAVWIHTVDKAAFVLGSTQRESQVLDAINARSAGYEVSGRRSGGGLVLVEPATSCWIDVLIPRDHQLWDDDIGRAFDWIGKVWALALTSLGVPGCQVHSGELENRSHGRLLCFAGLGPGEVVAEGSKVVGLSQRRTKQGARFQGLAISEWNPAPIKQFLTPGLLPQSLDIDAVKVGHPALTPQKLQMLPARLVHYLDSTIGDAS